MLDGKAEIIHVIFIVLVPIELALFRNLITILGLCRLHILKLVLD